MKHKKYAVAPRRCNLRGAFALRRNFYVPLKLLPYQVRRTRCQARVNVIDANDNPAKVKVIEYLDEAVSRGYYAFNTRSDSFSASSGVESDRIRVYENNRPGLALALIKVFDRDEISEYKFSILPAVYGTHNVSMFEIGMR